MADIQFPAPPLSGNFDATVQDNNGAPSNVLEANTTFAIRTQWSVSPQTARVLGGEFQVAAYVESIGPGEEKQIGPTVTVAVNGGTNYTANIVVPANTLPDLDPARPPSPTSGVYKLGTVLTHRNFGSFTDVAAIVDGPVLRIG
jgi:hypothetical protein